MTEQQHNALIKQLEDYETYGEMIDAVLKMDDERKLFCIAAVAYSTMQEEKDKQQMMLFIKVISHDLSIFKNKKQKMRWYKTIYDKTFIVKEADNETFDVGVNHDCIHNFLVDRLDLK